VRKHGRLSRMTNGSKPIPGDYLMAKNPMLPPRKPQDLIQSKHDKVHEDYTPQDTLDIIEETIE